jgi:hypothetical protein
MKHTREQLDGMSDFEASKTLCLLLGFDVSGITEQRNQMIGAVPNLYEDWSKIMPLAVEYKISIDWFSDGRCVAYQDKSDIDYSHQSESPQRAIACCLIMVLESKA